MDYGGGAALEFLERTYGGTLRDYEEVVSVTSATVQIVSGDADRVFLLVTNLGANAVYVAPTLPVSAARGIYLAANGGLLGFNLYQDGLMPVLPLFGFTAAAAMNVFVIRVRRETISPRSST